MNSRFAHITRQLVLALSFALVAASSPASASSSILADGQIELYFTNPGVSNETGGDTEADDALIALIDAAASTLDVCLYDFKHPALIDAIVDAHQRGVTVRFVGDDDETDQAGYIAVLDAGIPITLRLKSGIMHNKFLIVDGAFVATGSMNFSEAGVNRNNNHAMILDSAQAAADYLAEFEQMFIDANFGTSKTAFPRTPITLGGTTIDLAFSPKDNPEIVLRDALATADHSVYFMVFSFTRNDVAGDLIAHHNNGVEVVGIYDKFGATNRYATDEDLAEAGVPVLVDGNENKVGSSGGKLHHKVMIIDAGTDSDPIVIAGSYNWSGNASDTNDENVLVLRGNEAIAPFMAEFCEVFDAALPHALTTGDLPDPCAAPPVIANALRINELLPNPDGTDRPNEFVELVNTGDTAIDLTGWMVGDLTSDARHTFDGGLLAPGDAVVVYGGAAVPEDGRLVASSGNLSINNSAETISLFDPAGTLVDSVSYSASVSGVSLNRVNDAAATGDFDRHNTVSTADLNLSPGTRADGTAFIATTVDETPVDETPVLTNITVSDSGQVAEGEWTHYGPFEATADTTFTAAMTGTGDADLYVRIGAQPTTAAYDCRPYTSGSDEQCDIAVTETTIFFVSIQGYSAASFSLDIAYATMVGGTIDDTPGRANVVIAALMANPTGTDLGQEYIVLANTGDAAAEISDYTISDASRLRHVFAPGTILAAGETLVLFDRGDHGADTVLASTSSLSLNNGGDTIVLADAAGANVHTAAYTGSSEGQEVTLGTDF